jgi:hypothetical protein
VFSSVQGICSALENGPGTFLYFGPSHMLGTNNESEVMRNVRTMVIYISCYLIYYVRQTFVVFIYK